MSGGKMSAFLQCIEVENFKSYRGRTTIGPLKRFSAVIGPNGSGKSNFMDAISFVMGEKTSSLRVRKLTELINGASIGRPISNRASVMARFIIKTEAEGEVEKTFQRSVINASSEYRINGSVVSPQHYLAELEKIGINVKAKNFLVFQGAVETIAIKNAKERTALFEEISGSGLLKEDYNRLKHEMQMAEEETQFTYQKKRGIAAERKEARLEKQEADRYASLKQECSEKQVHFQLFKLYHNEKEAKRLKEDQISKQQELNIIEKRKEEADEVLKEKKKEVGKMTREMAKKEQEIREVEAEMSKRHPMFIKAKEKVAHTQKKLDGALKTLEQARRADEAHQADIKKLVDELQEVEVKRAAFENEVAGESKKRGSNVHLERDLVQEYDRLKQKADATSSKYLIHLDSVNREQKSDQDRLDSEINKKAQIEENYKKIESEKNEALKRQEKLIDHIKTSRLGLEEQKRIKAELSQDVGTSKERIHELQSELDNVREQLGDAKIDKHEDARRKKKQEVVELFKLEVPGVYDRMINMCQPTHKRYNVAVTKVLGKYMEAIIVDTEKTARRCIQILKEKMLDVETFLPLDYLQKKPLKERLRNIEEPRNVKLIYDVLKFSPPEIEPAVLFATNNALVCETPDDAMKVAYEIDRSRYDALALDGTFYQKSGIISGGSHDLARKAKRWDEKHMAQLKLQKEKITEELKEVMKKTRRQGELTTVESQIRGLENRLKYSMNDLETSKKNINEYDRQLEDFTRELDQIGPKISEIERRMQQRDMKIQDIKESMNNVEDDVYAEFCARIGVANIRQFEERELVLQQERAKKRAEFEQQIDRINNNLEFERSKDTSKNVQRWERAVQDDEDSLETFKQAEARQRQEIEKDKEKIELMKQEKAAHKTLVDQMEEEMAKARREVQALAKELAAIHQSIANIESRIESMKSKRQTILMQAKMESIEIPLLQGSMDDIGQQQQGQGGGQGAGGQGGEYAADGGSAYERESRIEIDYSKLEHHLKNLSDPDQIKKSGDSLAKELQSKLDTLEKIQTPNMKAMQKLDRVTEKIQSTNEEFEAARKKAKKAKAAFEKVKNERCTLFTNCCNHISDAIDAIYKQLSRNEAAQAYLGPDNPEEPYLDGINYNCVAPGKRFQPMSNLSGGEKTIAALALLFAIHSFQPAPFFVLDEIDAALDNTNIGKVASYIREKTTNLQTIVISLKEEFYCHADVLIGICPYPAECLVSQTLIFDLEKYGDYRQDE
ncbi:structural maintenance of chromosomes protein 1A [Anopheles arabiensis]|uniref:Structural maintenance of chromosomes protein n=3 Tax=gambiae species complex TaxID=44542 RepID=Q7QD42_ANOGA|nr:structural maintenance of chromosomes protein 1A [Anopheles arabiensis]XP_040225968.2 structural maintenance of chromosomes protein 1A [Anopheles coluzzii]XP_311953.3 structural maintenance of chromosomes protein 1A [Anopheles gambiae]EAA07609.3 AGAP002947-PA [Anopheles gambiae str. PEST]